jgi:hypothetical protein
MKIFVILDQCRGRAPHDTLSRVLQTTFINIRLILQKAKWTDGWTDGWTDRQGITTGAEREP